MSAPEDKASSVHFAAISGLLIYSIFSFFQLFPVMGSGSHLDIPIYFVGDVIHQLKHQELAPGGQRKPKQR